MVEHNIPQILAHALEAHSVPGFFCMVRNVKKIQTLSIACIALVALLSTACGSVTTPTVKTQLDEAKQLNSELRTEWEATETMMTQTESAVTEFPKLGIDATKLDLDLMKKALVECFDSPVKAAKDSAKGGGAATEKKAEKLAQKTGEDLAASCEGESVNTLQDLGANSDPDVNKFIQGKLGSVAMVKVNLKENLPNKSKDLLERFAKAKLKVEELRLAADATKTIADENPLLGDKAKKKFKAEYDQLQTELKAIEEIMSTMETGGQGLPERVQTMTVNFTQGMQNFGQQ